MISYVSGWSFDLSSQRIRFPATIIHFSGRAVFSALKRSVWLRNWELRHGNDDRTPKTSRDGSSSSGPMVSSMDWKDKRMMCLQVSVGCSEKVLLNRR